MKLIKTSFFSAIISIIRISSGFVTGKVIALITGPSGIALIGQFNNFITIVLTFSNGAINTGVIKYTAEYDGDKDKIKKLFSTSLKISIYCSAFFGLILLFSASFISDLLFKSLVYINPIRVLGLTIILYSLNTFLVAILNGLKQIKKYTIVNTAGSIIGLIFTLILVINFKLLGALYALVLTQSIVFFVTLVLVIKSDWFSWSFFNQPFDKNVAKKLSHYSLMAITSSICMPVSQIILRNVVIDKLGVDAAGYWQGMMRISDGYLLIVTMSLSTYYLPKLSSLFSNDELRKEIFKGYKIIMPLVFVSCSVIYLFRFLVIRILYSKDFEAMSELFFFQLLGDFFKIAAWLVAFLMTAKAMTKAFVISEIVFSLTYVLISYLCILYFKLNGITIAFAINYFLYFVTMIVIFRKILFKSKI
ncbi:O-antigen translocase [Flavobacterium bizetiae]|uniref:O-antigen translocase n=1 Tax=Flavobacterium bizetiae TaxID=2704140 RepID=UPI0021E738FA|nr:O-antigen translocase [Flavobacterium bizetiae]UTN04635.1 O-antigen translocase [Flavobacterium bizetiae]